MILLSSYFLCNSIGDIDESALHECNLVFCLSKFIGLKIKDTVEGPNLILSFLWESRNLFFHFIVNNKKNIVLIYYLEKVLN